MELNFPVTPIIRNLSPTPLDTPKISKGNSGKRLFQSLPHLEFPESALVDDQTPLHILKLGY